MIMILVLGCAQNCCHKSAHYLPVHLIVAIKVPTIYLFTYLAGSLSYALPNPASDIRPSSTFDLYNGCIA